MKLKRGLWKIFCLSETLKIDFIISLLDPLLFTVSVPQRLQTLFDSFDACRRCRKQANPLRHILGGGLFESPRYLFLFINPTHHNISSHRDYDGARRYPFIGVRYFWKLMSEAGAIDRAIVEDIYASGWKTEHEHAIETDLRQRGIYITNLVKCTQPHPENPSLETIAEDWELLQQEIRAVNPESIVTFGKLPTKILTGADLKLSDWLEEVRHRRHQPLNSRAIAGKVFDVLPCYFPVGRGNPLKAKEILARFLSGDPLPSL